MNHTSFFLGMVLLQVIFIIYQYLLFRRKEFVYYLLYTFCVGVFVFFKIYPEYNPVHRFVTPDEVFTPGRSVMLTCYAMYFRFGRQFTETPTLYPRLNRQLIVVEYLFLLFSAVDVLLLLIGVPFPFLEPLSKTIYLMAMPFSVYAIVYLFTRRQKLTSIYVIGSGLLLLFASAGFIDRIFLSQRAYPESYYLRYVELGIFCEFLFLNYGLIYKTRMIQKENMRLEVEKQVALYKQRMRISADLHDEVGATLSGIALYSQITRQQMDRQQTELVEQSLSRMQQSAAEMVDKLSEIVWTVNPEQDSLQKLLLRVEEYAQEMGATRGIRVHCSTQCEEEFPLAMELRRNVYLIAKEAINNAVKYSGCDELVIEASVRPSCLSLTIQDNGSGFDPAVVRRGNGLDNISRRAEASGLQLQIDSAPERGTTIRLTQNSPNEV